MRAREDRTRLWSAPDFAVECDIRQILAPGRKRQISWSSRSRRATIFAPLEQRGCPPQKGPRREALPLLRHLNLLYKRNRILATGLLEFAMFGWLTRNTRKTVSAQELKALMDRGRALVVDVREPHEFAQGHIPGAINRPLSSLDPGTIPQEEGKVTILHCKGGVRSAKAIDRCAAENSPIDTHLGGGFGEWRSAGLPIER